MATKKLVPRATNEGGLGTALKVWGPSWLQNLTITNLQTSTSNSVLVETAGNVEKRAASSFPPNLESKDEGVSLTTTTMAINYVGTGVTATVGPAGPGNPNEVTVTIPGTCPVDTDDTTTYVGLWDTATGCQDPKTDAGIRFDALNNVLKVGDDTGNNRIWYDANKITKFLGLFTLKSQHSFIHLWANGDKITFRGFAGSYIATMYGKWGTQLHVLNEESAPTYVLTEAVPGGGTTTPHAIPAGINGVITKTPVSFFANPNVVDTEDTTTNVLLHDTATGVLAPKTDEGLLYDALNDHLKVHGRLTVGADDTNTFKIIERGNTSLNQAGGNLIIAAGGVSAGAGNNLGGGILSLYAGQGTGAASAGGSDSSILFYTYKDVAAGSTAQTGQASHSFYADSQNRFRINAQDSPSNFFNISVGSSANTLIETLDNAGTAAHMKLKVDGDLYFEPATNITYHGRISGDSYFRQKGNDANLPAGNFWLMGADALGNYTGAGTATGGNLNYAAGAGTGTGPNGQHIWWLSEIYAAGNLGVVQPLRMAMTLATDNDENALLSLSALDGNMSLFVHCGQDRARIYTPTVGKTIEIGAKTTNGSLIKFQDHTTTVYGDTLATVHSLRTESFLFALSDETSNLASGNDKLKFRMPYAFTLTDIRASVNVAPTGADIVVDVLKNGVSVTTSNLTIDAGDTTSVGSGSAVVIGTAAIADDDIISFNLTQTGSTDAGKGLKVTLIGHKTV